MTRLPVGIYRITNNKNGKVYIGQSNDIERRFSQHQSSYEQERFSDKPLYKAFAKYGIENFHIELIEETDNPEEREKFWIEQKRSFKNGYNATKGGDGKAYLDYDVLIETYKNTSSEALMTVKDQLIERLDILSMRCLEIPLKLFLLTLIR